jgi:hypothetical protein
MYPSLEQSVNAENNTAALEKCSDDINVKYGGIILINKNQNMKKIFLILVLFTPLHQKHNAENIIIITTDGFRWQLLKVWMKTQETKIEPSGQHLHL